MIFSLIMIVGIPAMMWDIGSDGSVTPLGLAISFGAVAAIGSVVAVAFARTMGMTGFGMFVGGGLGFLAAIFGGQGFAFAASSLVAVVGGIVMQQVAAWALRQREAAAIRRYAGPPLARDPYMDAVMSGDRRRAQELAEQESAARFEAWISENGRHR